MDDSSLLLDTNVLLSATAPARDLQHAALDVLNEWPGEGTRLCISGQILREYLVVATREPAQNGLGLSIDDALANAAAITARCRFLDENQSVTKRLQELLRTVECSGKQIHDANLVATCLVHGVPALVTANAKDFERFRSSVRVRALGSPAPAP